MATITNPTIMNTNNNNPRSFGELPIRADATSAKRYIQDNGLGTYGSFTSAMDNRFSDSGGHSYNYYVSGVTTTDYWLNTGVTYAWKTEYGYGPTIATITYT